ncbi:hypothetical protein OROHE_012626 [Orobanche hederae]
MYFSKLTVLVLLIALVPFVAGMVEYGFWTRFFMHLGLKQGRLRELPNSPKVLCVRSDDKGRGEDGCDLECARLNPGYFGRNKRSSTAGGECQWSSEYGWQKGKCQCWEMNLPKRIDTDIR